MKVLNHKKVKPVVLLVVPEPRLGIMPSPTLDLDTSDGETSAELLSSRYMVNLALF